MQQDSVVAMVTPAGYDPQPPPSQGNMQSGGANIQAPATSGPEFDQDQAIFEADKRAVYKHPLFPLLALLFERCEQATQSAESPNSENFNMDIQAFVQHQERDRKPFLVNDPEIDGLMIKAIQVLRIHLLELEKVQELCKDFCNRYITCLKGKMQSENLLRSDYAFDNNNLPGSTNNNSSSSAGSPPPPMLHNYHPHHQNMNLSHYHQSAAASSSAAQLAYQMATHPLPSVSPPPMHQGAPLMSGSSSSSSVPASPGIVHGSTPLSQIGATACAPPSDSSLLQNSLSPAPTSPGSMDEEDDSFLGVGSGKSKKPKRGVLPKHATSIMRSWLFQHLVHPYPTEDEKRQIAAQTNLTLLQVNNWFINARRRILQPMLDASTPTDTVVSGHKTKKSKNSTGGGSKQAAQRFWPDSIASLQPQLGLNGNMQVSESSVISSTTPLSSDDESEEDSEEESGDEGSSDDESKPTTPGGGSNLQQ
ncbi:homeobox protein PKNOX1-like isoform X2 [Neocloeon triangulifer]|uniref:homeobox protein PKNOX1-like isoform X2 n=1 Tax=Neocloeon triangulifer TaxID=2078957 RepID=UPI00286F947F|nr:homeobox protein PKNOX1-like isoform X2 [Neocloeon triangulifer]